MFTAKSSPLQLATAPTPDFRAEGNQSTQEWHHAKRAHCGPELRPCGRHYALRESEPAAGRGGVLCAQCAGRGHKHKHKLNKNKNRKPAGPEHGHLRGRKAGNRAGVGRISRKTSDSTDKSNGQNPLDIAVTNALELLRGQNFEN
jgi:hypothetical protein